MPFLTNPDEPLISSRSNVEPNIARLTARVPACKKYGMCTKAIKRIPLQIQQFGSNDNHR